MKGKKYLWLAALIPVIIVLVLLLVPRTTEQQKAFIEKAKVFKEAVVTDETVAALGESTVDGIGHVVLFSVSDGASRAKVYAGKGKTLSEAWDDGVQRTSKGIKGDSTNVLWLRADVVSKSWPATALDMLNELEDTASGFDYTGLAFDPRFETALLEGMLNGMGLYDYSDNRIDIDRLNDWLEANGKEPLKIIPDDMIGFEAWGWFCDENNAVYPLCREGADRGRRQIPALDADYAKEIIYNASSYLMNQVNADGTFIYGLRPQFDKEIDSYNILRHAGTIWSLICRYRIFPDDALKEKIDSTIAYMLDQIRYDDTGAGYMFEADDAEIKLGGNGIAILALM